MRIALAGRPGAGKSSLFDLLARRTAPGKEDGGRGGLRVTHVDVPDPRLTALSEAFRPKKTTPARLQFDDLEQKSGPVYPILSPERREMLSQGDLILLVCDLYGEDPDHWGELARTQWRSASDEFVISDLAVIETRLGRLEKLLRIGQKPAFPGEPELLRRLREELESGRPVREFRFTPEEERALRGYAFLSARPVLPAFNVGEEHLEGSTDALASALAGFSGGSSWVLFCAPVETQILQMPAEEQAGFREAFGLAEPAVAQVIRASYNLAGLHCFFTVGEDEVRAWSIPKGARAPEAAGAIHSDLEKGFVRAEVLSYADWERFGSIAAAREKGAFRLEGKEYEVLDGDILNIRSGLAAKKG